MRVKDEGKRSAIYRAAMKVITDQGLAKASMSKIAKEAGVSPATIYIYFENKVDMLNKIYLTVKEESSAFLFKDFSEETGCREGMELYMRNLFAFMTVNPLHFSFHEQFLNSPEITPETRAAGLQEYRPLQKLLHRGIEENILGDYPLVLLGAFTFAPIYSLIKSHLNGDRTVSEELLREAVEMAWRAVRA